VIGGLRSASHLINRTWIMIGGFRTASHLTLQKVEYDWWVPPSLATYPKRTWNVIGGFRSALHLTTLCRVRFRSDFTSENGTWNMIGGFRSASHLTIETWHMISRVPPQPSHLNICKKIGGFRSASYLTIEMWHMIGRVLLSFHI